MGNNRWAARCREMLEWNPPRSKAEFIESVLLRIEENPEAFPTDKQVAILSKIYAHLWRRNMSDLEREVLADEGRLV